MASNEKKLKTKLGLFSRRNFSLFHNELNTVTSKS